MKQNIAIVMGGYTSEYAISLKSGNVVHQYLDRDKYKPYRIVITRDQWYYWDEADKHWPVNRHDFSLELPDGKVIFDCVFNAIHGSPGEDGQLQAYLGLLGLPQTSCGHYQAALTYNKRDLLSALKPYGIPTAKSYHLDLGDPIDPDAIVAAVGLPCFVKANRAGSSYGVSKVHGIEDLESAISTAFNEDDEIIIESFLEGTEVSVGVITHDGKPTVLPITEIVSENDFFDYEAKYQGKSQEITPARITPEETQAVSEMALKIYTKLKLQGYSRSEFIFMDGIPHLLEVNTTPGLTEASILPQQAAAVGIPLPELFGSAIEEALR